MKKLLSVLLLYLTILCAACGTEPEPTTITLLSIPLSAHIGHGRIPPPCWRKPRLRFWIWTVTERMNS